MKSLFIVLFVVLVNLSVFLGGYLFHKKVSTPKIDQDTSLENNALVARFKTPSQQELNNTESVIIRNIGENIFSTGRKNDEFIVYNKNSGLIESFSYQNTQTQSKIGTIKPAAQSLVWSQNKSKLVAEYRDNSIFYDFEKSTSKQYPKGISRVSISPTGEYIAYLFQEKDTGNYQITISDSSLSTTKKLLATQANNWYTTWLNDELLGLVLKKQNQFSFYTLEKDSGSLKKIMELSGVSDYAWLQGEKLLVSIVEEGKPLLRVVSLKNETTSDYAIGLLLKNCVGSFGGNHIFCFGIIQNEQSQNTIVKINLESGKQEEKIGKTKLSNIKIKEMHLSLTEDGIFVRSDKNDMYYFSLNDN